MSPFKNREVLKERREWGQMQMNRTGVTKADQCHLYEYPQRVDFQLLQYILLFGLRTHTLFSILQYDF